MSTMREALELIADIADGSRTANSLPNIKKIARNALSPDDCRRTIDFLHSLGVDFDQDTPPTDLKSLTVRCLNRHVSFNFDETGKFKYIAVETV